MTRLDEAANLVRSQTADLGVSFTGFGFSRVKEPSLRITASGSPCAAQYISDFLVTCLTSASSVLEEPNPGPQGVRHSVWKTHALTLDPNEALLKPDHEMEAPTSGVLPTFQVPYDQHPEPFVESMTSILTVPASFSGEKADLNLIDLVHPKRLKARAIGLPCGSKGCFSRQAKIQ